MTASPAPVTGPVEPAGSGRGRAATAMLALLLGAGLLAAILAGTTSATFELDRFSVPKELVLHVTALLCALVLSVGWRRIRLTVPEALLVAFIIWSLLSALQATNRWIALRALALGVSGLLVFLAARAVAAPRPATDTFHDPAPSRARADLLAWIALAAMVGAATGVVQAYGLELPGLAEERAPGGTFGNRNFLAHLTSIAIPVISLVALRARRMPARVLWWGGLVLCGNAIVLTRSRAGWLALAVAAGVALLGVLIARRTMLTTRRDVRDLGAIAVALAAGATAALVLPNTLEWRSDSPYAETLTRLTDYRGGSGRGRLIQYGNTLSLVARNPVFGTGPGNWFIEYPLVTTDGDPSFAGADPIPTNPWPSSDWIALLAERGPTGLLLVLLAGAALSLTALRRLRSDDAERAGEAVALLAMLGAVVVTGLFDAVLLNAAPTFFVAAATGLLMPPSRPLIDRAIGVRSRAAIVALTLAMAVAAVVRSSQQFAAIRIVDRGEASTRSMERALEADPANHRLHLRLASRGTCATRLPHARAAARLMPHHAAPRRALAACGRGGDG